MVVMTEASGASPSAELAQRLYSEGLAAFRRGENAECRRLSAAAVAAGSASAAPREQALGHVGLSRADFRDGAYADGTENARIAGELAQRAGADDVAVLALHMQAELTRAQGSYDMALPLYEQLLATDEAAGDLGSLAMEHYNLGSVLLQNDQIEAARTHLCQSLELCDGAATSQLPYTLLGFSGLLARVGDPATAGLIMGAVEAHFAADGEVLDPAEQLELATHVQAARARDADAFDTARAQGAGLRLEQAREALVRTI